MGILAEFKSSIPETIKRKKVQVNYYELISKPNREGEYGENSEASKEQGSIVSFKGLLKPQWKA